MIVMGGAVKYRTVEYLSKLEVNSDTACLGMHF